MTETQKRVYTRIRPGMLVSFSDTGVALFVTDNLYLKEGRLKKYFYFGEPMCRRTIPNKIVRINPEKL